MGMNINLIPQLEDFIRQKVDSGMYNRASEVVRDADVSLNQLLLNNSGLCGRQALLVPSGSRRAGSLRSDFPPA